MSEVRVDIMTTLGKYTAVTGADSHAYLSHVLENVKCDVDRGAHLEGWTPFDDPAAVPAMPFVLGKGAEIQHLKVYIHEAAQRDSSVAKYGEAQRDNGVCRVEIKGTVLGQKCVLVAYLARVDNLLYAMPVEINGSFCLDVMKEHNVQTLIDNYMDDKHVPADGYRILMPEIPIGEEDAEAYMNELVDAERPHLRAEGKDRAWPGWHEP